MKIKTYYWELNSIDIIKNKIRQKLFNGHIENFKIGNAGDIFVKNLIHYLYKSDSYNTKLANNRLLLIGSIAHLVNKNDILAGIGFKCPDYNIKNPENLNIYGVRGPISYDYFKRQGCNMKNVKFQLDPGLMVKFMIQDQKLIKTPKNVVFIPHFREREQYRHNTPKGIKFVDIDDYPMNILKEILEAKMVYTSSLHGLIFSHALGVPCHLIAPQTQEPEIKYKDYYSSIGLDYIKPKSSINDVNFITDSDTPFDLKLEKEDFHFPTLSDLKNLGAIMDK